MDNHDAKDDCDIPQESDESKEEAPHVVDFLSEMQSGGTMFENHRIRTVYNEPDGWVFHGADLCKALGYSNARDRLKKLDEKHKRPGVAFYDGSSQTRYVTFSTRAGI